MVAKWAGRQQSQSRPVAEPPPRDVRKRPAPAAATDVASAPPPRKARVKALSRGEITEIFRRFAAIEPAPKGELEHSNPFTLLVAVVLSAQATDAGVNKATPALFAAVLPIASACRKARRRWRWSRTSFGSSRPSSECPRTTG